MILLDTCESGALVAGHARSRVVTPASEAAAGGAEPMLGNMKTSIAGTYRAPQDAVNGGARGSQRGGVIGSH